MNPSRIILPLAVAGSVLAAVLATAVLVNAAELPSKAGTPCCQAAEAKALFNVAPLSVSLRDRLAEVDRPTTVQPAVVDALFDIAPFSASMRARQAEAAGATPLQQAEAEALFDVAPLSDSMRARLVQADATLQQAEVAALFNVAPRKSVPAQPQENPVSQ